VAVSYACSMGIRSDEGVLITGVYGAGKSTVAAEISYLLEQRRQPYALLDLDFLGWGVNSFDQVVGYSYLPAFNATTDPAVQPGASPVRQVAFVWYQGTMTDLNKLIGAAAEKYHLNSAMAINDNGQIVATALSKATGARRAVLLTPTK